MPTPPKKRGSLQQTGKRLYTRVGGRSLDARARADEEARRMLGATPSGTRTNPAPLDPDLVNLASDLEHGFLLSSPDDAR